MFSLDHGHPMIRIRDLNKSETSVRFRGPFVESARVHPGDVLVGMDGDFNVGTWCGEQDALLNQRMCCVRSTDHLVNEWLEYALGFPLRQINDVTYATTVKHLSSWQVERVAIAIPPPSELGTLVQHVRDQRKAYDRAIVRQERELELVREYRTRLISDVVTGQLDVRTAAVGLPVVEQEAAPTELEGDETDTDDGEAL
jgi:type I restriction enzyme S subunit